jgi:hypothetical protein
VRRRVHVQQREKVVLRSGRRRQRAPGHGQGDLCPTYGQDVVVVVDPIDVDVPLAFCACRFEAQPKSYDSDAAGNGRARKRRDRLASRAASRVDAVGQAGVPAGVVYQFEFRVRATAM